jgi:rod shape-determining protein MreC
VAFREGPFEKHRVPLTWTAGLAVLVAAAIAALLLIGDRREAAQGGVSYGKARGVFDAVVGRTNGVLAAPMRWIGQGAHIVGDYIDAANENRRLRSEISTLKAVEDQNAALQNINRRYEALLNIRTEPPVRMVTARAVAESRGPFANSRLIDTGADKGVRIGNPVINEHGLIGRVVGATGGVSRVLLLTDISSRTPVLVDRTDARAILSGDGSDNPKLEYLRGKDAIREGDRILSSGDGGMLPRGLPVGVAARGLDGSWRVKLFSSEGSIDYVRVLLFEDFAQLVQPDSLNAPPLASLNTAPAPSPELAAKIEALHPAHTYTGASSRPAAAAKPAPKATTAAPTTATAVPSSQTESPKSASSKPASSKAVASNTPAKVAAGAPPKKAKPKVSSSDDAPPKKAKPKVLSSDDAPPGGNRP